MNDSVILQMVTASKTELTRLLHNVSHLALCVDAWTTSTGVSYITLKCHLCDSDFKFTSYVVDTTESVTTYTIEKLESHIEKVLAGYGITAHKPDNVMVIFNCTSYTDIHNEDAEQPYGRRNLFVEPDNPECSIELNQDDTQIFNLNVV